MSVDAFETDPPTNSNISVSKVLPQGF
jgi:hypothetical protein